MDIPWGDERAVQFVSNIGLITTKGDLGYNIMACEWTSQVSYRPALIVISVSPKNATHGNLTKTKVFGVGIASSEQGMLSSIAGSNTGSKVDKIKALEELGIIFYKAKKIDVLMVKDTVLNLECRVINEIQQGDHTLFVGEVLEASLNKEKIPLVYHKGKYGTVLHNIPKPTPQEMERFSKILKKYVR